MSRHARFHQHAIAPFCWIASLAWLGWGPHQPGLHRTMIGAAIAASVIAAMDARALDLTEAIRLARAAGYLEAQSETRAER